MKLNNNLELCCFTNCELLKKEIQKVADKNCEYEFSLYHDLETFSILMSDVFVFDAAFDLTEVATTLRNKKRHRISILVGDKSEIIALDKEVLAVFDQIIFKDHLDILLEQAVNHSFDVAKEKNDLYLAEHYLNTLIDGIPDLVWVKDIRGAHLKVNDSFCKAVGKEKQQVVNRGHNYIWDLTVDEYKDGEYICLESEDETISRRITCTFNEIVKTKAGLRNFQTHKTPIFDPETGEVIGTVGIARDVTDVNNVINEQNEFFNSIPIGLIVCDENNRIINVNKKAASIFRMSSLDLCNLHYEDLSKQYFSKIEPAIKEKHDEVEIIKNNELHIYDVANGIIKDIFKNSRGHYYIFHEVTVERQYQKQLFHNASTDSLSGLLNREYFYKKIDEKQIYPNCNVFYLDVDKFKQINDNYGHHVGDTVIKVLSSAMKTIFPNAHCVRMGGDEFIIADFGTATEEEILNSTKQLQMHVDELIRLEFGDNLYANISIGISLNKHHQVTVKELINQADYAMYRAKNNGGRQAIIYSNIIE